MARKRVPQSEDDYSDHSDDAYEPGPSQVPKVRRAKHTVKRRKHTSSVLADVSDGSKSGIMSEDVSLSRSHTITVHTITEVEPLREALLDWYAGVHETRGMPWRKPYDPSLNDDERAQRAYEVWISEIMLQQTQVATVIPYYTRWMARFPTIEDLAASDIETVNGLWKGLGYYSRAARLLSGAQKAVEDFGGRLPDNAKDMETKIPGIGRYSAGAICSIAYNACVPVLDGNVHRLLSRLLALHSPPKAKQTLDVLWRGATDMVEGSARPGDLNQALIELGSTVCKVRDPHCNSCPLQRWCQAYKYQTESEGKESRDGTSEDVGEVRDIEELCTLCEPLPAGSPVTSFPMKVEKKKAREELDIVNVIEWRRHADGERWFLLVRRPEGGLLAGLHEFPTVSNVPVTISASAQTKLPCTLLSDLLVSPPKEHRARISEVQMSEEVSDGESSTTLRIAKIKPAGDVIHVFSHIKKTYRVQWVLLEGGGDQPPPLSPPGSSRVVVGGEAKLKKKAGGRNISKDAPLTAEARGQPGIVRAAWTQREKVADANIGTGVLKVWRQVQTVWDDDV